MELLYILALEAATYITCPYFMIHTNHSELKYLGDYELNRFGSVIYSNLAVS